MMDAVAPFDDEILTRTLAEYRKCQRSLKNSLLLAAEIEFVFGRQFFAITNSGSGT
jgi:hypothetical protein